MHEIYKMNVEQMESGKYYFFRTFTNDGESRVIAKYIGINEQQNNLLQFVNVLVNGDNNGFRLHNLFLHNTDIFDIELLPSGVVTFIYMLLQLSPNIDADTIGSLSGYTQDLNMLQPSQEHHGLENTNVYYNPDNEAPMGGGKKLTGSKKSKKLNIKSRKNRRR